MAPSILALRTLESHVIIAVSRFLKCFFSCFSWRKDCSLCILTMDILSVVFRDRYLCWMYFNQNLLSLSYHFFSSSSASFFNFLNFFLSYTRAEREAKRSMTDT